MRFDLRSPNWWWILPLTLLVHVVVADPFEKNHQRRQYTALNTLENLALPKRDIYGPDAMAQMPREVKNPGGASGDDDHSVAKRMSLNFLDDVPRLFLNGESSAHGQDAGHGQINSRGEHVPRLFLNDNSIDHGQRNGHGGGNTDKRDEADKHDEAEKRAFGVPSPELSIRSGERRAVKDTTAPRAEPAILEDRLPTPMAVAARDGKLGETMRIKYLKKRGLGQVSLRRDERRLSSIR